jgi:hypothetical protein
MTLCRGMGPRPPIWPLIVLCVGIVVMVLLALA